MQRAITRKRRAVLLVDKAVDGRGPQAKKVNREKEPFSWDAHVQKFTESDFKQRYRLDFDSFQVLLGIIKDDLTLSDIGKKRSAASNFGVVVALEVKLAIALRYLAGGMVCDL